MLVLDPADTDVEHLLPGEPPVTLGPVGEAVSLAAPDAEPVMLARRNGQRVSAADAYLRAVGDRPNLAVIREHFPTAVRHDARAMTLREIFVALARTYRLDNGAKTEVSQTAA